MNRDAVPVDSVVFHSDEAAIVRLFCYNAVLQIADLDTVTDLQYATVRYGGGG